MDFKFKEKTIDFFLAYPLYNMLNKKTIELKIVYPLGSVTIVGLY